MSQSDAIDNDDLPGSGDDPSAVPTWYGGMVFTILVLFSVYFLVFLADSEQISRFDHSIRSESRWLNEVKSRQEQQLETYSWTDAENNRVSIPLEQGREKVLKRFGHSGQE
jgi:membrane associated rhomboid family serine protease